MSIEKYYVYHIHRKVDSDLSQGYIGVSKKPEGRWKNHKYSGNEHLKNAISKYDDIQYNIIAQGTKEYCLKLEYDLRPLPRIGWNIVEGGGMPPTMIGKDNPMFGKISPRRGKPRPKKERERISKTLRDLHSRGVLDNKGKNNPRYGDHRSYEEIHGNKKAQQIVEGFSIDRTGTGNSNAAKWKLTSPDGRVEILCGNCKQRLLELGLSMKALKDNINLTYAIGNSYRNKPSSILVNTIGWKLKKLSK